ncbi:MAG TPA: hypothetical protein VG435_05810 [Acidimicrobiales bacterium]|jgi:hypothetical protein|nr:hypothetical protein [Acidimicrobiales bacterium]
MSLRFDQVDFRLGVLESGFHDLRADTRTWSMALLSTMVVLVGALIAATKL